MGLSLRQPARAERDVPALSIAQSRYCVRHICHGDRIAARAIVIRRPELEMRAQLITISVVIRFAAEQFHRKIIHLVWAREDVRLFSSL